MNLAFEKFTEHARQAMTAAQAEAQKHQHHFMGTEHMLLGLLDVEDCTAVTILRELDVEPQLVRAQVEHIIGQGDRIVHGEIPLTRRSKKALELTVDEALRLNVHSIGTEHLLAGLVREGEGIAAGALESMGINLEKVRRQLSILSQRRRASGPGEGGPKSNVVTCRLDDRALGALDALVEAGIRSTRSDAAAWLINAGIESHSALFDRLDATIREIRQLRQEAQDIARQVASDTEGRTRPNGE
ncbi:MAG TPA: Clp protease N-terminal domain-containing protein [Ktedonobacterales bacterium]|jgi:ATP-dependent Clp protease ATP-binding subunit ClpA|nr:Clp protease N-terminal domain-containing protein [Ktedonobacterales bacterium]